jgi:hypothetical protein
MGKLGQTCFPASIGFLDFYRLENARLGSTKSEVRNEKGGKLENSRHAVFLKGCLPAAQFE